jgi:hypothetical protein
MRKFDVLSGIVAKKKKKTPRDVMFGEVLAERRCWFKVNSGMELDL